MTVVPHEHLDSLFFSPKAEREKQSLSTGGEEKNEGLSQKKPKGCLTEVAGSRHGVTVLVVAPAAPVAVDSILTRWAGHVTA